MSKTAHELDIAYQEFLEGRLLLKGGMMAWEEIKKEDSGQEALDK